MCRWPFCTPFLVLILPFLVLVPPIMSYLIHLCSVLFPVGGTLYLPHFLVIVPPLISFLCSLISLLLLYPLLNRDRIPSPPLFLSLPFGCFSLNLVQSISKPSSRALLSSLDAQCASLRATGLISSDCVTTNSNTEAHPLKRPASPPSPSP